MFSIGQVYSQVLYLIIGWMGQVWRCASLRSKKEQEASDLVLANLKQSLVDVKTPWNHDQFVAKHTTFNMVVSMEAIDQCMGQSTAQNLGVHRQNMKAIAHRRQRILAMPICQRLWTSNKRALCSDCVS